MLSHICQLFLWGFGLLVFDLMIASAIGKAIRRNILRDDEIVEINRSLGIALTQEDVR